MNKKLQELKNILSEVYDLEKIGALLWWDQATYMPPGGAQARARQEALVGRLAHEMFIQPQVGRLLDALRPYEESLPYESDDASLIRVTRREYERLVRVPPSFTSGLSAHAADFYQAWSEARPANDFRRLHNMMEKSLDFSHIRFLPATRILDPLLDQKRCGMTVAFIKSLFAELRPAGAAR
jgi:carboxypeptidase Taq